MAAGDTTACSCGSMIRWVPTVGGRLMPVDVGADPHGNLLAVRIPGKGWGVRALTAAELAAGDVPGHRYSAHWSTCPHAAQYRAQARRLAPQTWPERGGAARPSTRAGPCGACGTVHPYRYGPGPSSNLCDACRAEKGLPPVS